MDLQKAFDKVDHNISLEKIQHYGIKGIAQQWFKCYLENRKQFVPISGAKSELASVNCDVSQPSRYTTSRGRSLMVLY